MVTKEFLRSVDLFAGLGDEDAGALAALAREDTCRKGQVVFHERDPGDRFYVVISGVIEVSKAPPGRGRPVCLARLERGETLGEMATFDAGPRSASAVAAVVPETRLASWDGAAFRRFLAERPRAAAVVLGALVRKLSGRLRATSEAVQTLLRALEGAGA